MRLSIKYPMAKARIPKPSILRPFSHGLLFLILPSTVPAAKSMARANPIAHHAAIRRSNDPRMTSRKGTIVIAQETSGVRKLAKEMTSAALSQTGLSLSRQVF